MPVNIGKIIKDSQIMVLVVSPEDYTQQLQDITAALSGLGKKICYISLNKPYMSIRGMLEKAKISTDNLYFIDAVSSKVGSMEPDKKAMFISSPQALTELSISINKGIEMWKVDAILFDSLSTLLVYEGSSSVLKFVHSIINSIRVKGLLCVFTVLKQDLKEELTKDLGMFADKIEKMK